MRREILRMERVTYKEQGITTLRDFELNIFEGEILGLLPINAYGLQSFLRILRRNPPLYYGYVYYMDTMVDSWQDMKRRNNRISIIGGKSSLVDGQSVLSNIFILRPGFRQEILRMNLLRKQLQPFLDDIGLSVSPDTPVEKLTVFERVVVEILRAVVAGDHLIVLLEISTLINDSEIMRLHGIMKHYADRGTSFLYISPHFEEILQICDRAAIMTNGSIVKMLYGKQMNTETLENFENEYDIMVRSRLNTRKHSRKRELVFEVKNLCGEFIKNLNFQVRSGECLVIQFEDNRIYQEFLQFITGNKSALKRKFFIKGKAVNPCKNQKMAVILEQPGHTMLFNTMSYLDNLCMSLDLRVPSVWRNRNIRKSIRREYSPILGEEVFDKKISSLTEIEKTELVYARIMLQKPKIVFCVQPFKGADMVHRMRIWELQEMFLSRGISVVILAINMADALSLADRIIRIEPNTTLIEYERKDFNRLPMDLPWSRLYKQS